MLSSFDDKRARLWNGNGTEIGVLRGHERSINRTVFSPDGTRIVTCSNDGTARFLRASTAPKSPFSKGMLERCLMSRTALTARGY